MLPSELVVYVVHDYWNRVNLKYTTYMYICQNHNPISRYDDDDDNDDVADDHDMYVFETSNLVHKTIPYLSQNI